MPGHVYIEKKLHRLYLSSSNFVGKLTDESRYAEALFYQKGTFSGIPVISEKC